MPKKQYILISFFSHFVECVVYFTNLDAVLCVRVGFVYHFTNFNLNHVTLS